MEFGAGGTFGNWAGRQCLALLCLQSVCYGTGTRREGTVLLNPGACWGSFVAWFASHFSEGEQHPEWGMSSGVKGESTKECKKRGRERNERWTCQYIQYNAIYNTHGTSSTDLVSVFYIPSPRDRASVFFFKVSSTEIPNCQCYWLFTKPKKGSTCVMWLWVSLT